MTCYIQNYWILNLNKCSFCTCQICLWKTFRMSSLSKWYWWPDELAAVGTLITMSILSNGTQHLSSHFPFCWPCQSWLGNWPRTSHEINPDIPVFCWYFNNIANIPLPGIFIQDVLTWIWQYNVRSRFNHVYSNPEHMSVFMSCDILPINMAWCCTWYNIYTLKNLTSYPDLRRSTASFSTYKILVTAILFLAQS